MDRELEASVELVEQPANFYEIILLKGVDVIGNIVPHFGVKMAAAVRKRERQIKLSAFFGLGLFRDHKKRGGDHLVFKANTITDVKLFHAYSEFKIGRASCRERV